MTTRLNHPVLETIFGFGLLLGAAQVHAQTSEYVQDRILLKPSVPSIDALHQQLGTRVLRRFPLIENIQVVQLPQGMTVPQAIAQFQNSGQVQFAEPDYVLHADVTLPNDPYYTDGTLWGLNIINAPNGWDRR